MASTCGKCGSPVSPTTSYLTEVGLLCWRCFGQFQTEKQQAEARDATLQRSFTRRAWVLACVHAGMWVTVAFVAAGKAVPTLVGSILLLLVVAFVVGIGRRQRWAYLAALALDGAGALALASWAVARREGLILVTEIFPLALLTLTWSLRFAYAPKPPATGDADLLSTAPRPRRRWLPLLALPAVGLVVAGAFLMRRSMTSAEPGREMMRIALPTWQLTRARIASGAGGPAARGLVAAAQKWPALATAFDALDRAWPAEAPVRDAAASVNRALADAGLPYFGSVWLVNDRPYVLSHQLLAHVPWHIGDRTIDLLRLRRLDTINIDFASDGITQNGLPLAMLDRIEATLARELPAMYEPAKGPHDSGFNEFDRAALARTRSWLEARLGAGLAQAAAALRERARLLEEMRTRLRGNDVQLGAPDGFVLGDDWLDVLEPQTHLDHPGGRLFLDFDLQAVTRADRALRSGPIAEALAGAVELSALSIEAHEARHAAEAAERSSPPPPELFAVMPSSSTSMVGFADSELQAYLGTLHDAPTPTCVNVAIIMRPVYGRWARREPHYYAGLALLKQLGADLDGDPAHELSVLCAVPDAELRNRVTALWQRFYRAPMAPGERLPPQLAKAAIPPR